MENNTDRKYFDMVKYIKQNGREKSDRTGTGTISLFDYNISFDMSEGFPLITSKKMHYNGIIHELVWFLKGDTNIKYLVDNGVNIWNGDVYKFYLNNIKDKTPLSDKEFIEMIKTDEDFCDMWGDLGPVYGQQWRDAGGWTELVLSKKKDHNGFFQFVKKRHKGIDQITNLVNQLTNNPDSRRMVVDAWNVKYLPDMKLPPCHFAFQCYTYVMTESERIEEWCKSLVKDISYGEDMTHEDLNKSNFPTRKLDLKSIIRSNDIFLGCPYNIASYALLTHLLANEVNMIPGKLSITIGDAHIYLNHLEACEKQLNQKTYKLPNVSISKKSIFDIEFDDIKILNYKSSPRIKGELSN